jgi:hypothetical protein
VIGTRDFFKVCTISSLGFSFLKVYMKKIMRNVGKVLCLRIFRDGGMAQVVECLPSKVRP